MAKGMIDFAKFKEDIRKATDLEVRIAMNKLTSSDKILIGRDAIIEMFDMISKGISPIREFGRFPGYKWATFKNEALKVAAGQSDKKNRRQSRREIKRHANSKYPYSMKKKYPGKKDRPVNLYLSGNFLDSLMTWTEGSRLFIGFKDKKSQDIEKGHRTGGVKGVNDQPKRPIIPESGEEFSPSIYRRIADKVQEIFRRKFGT